MVDAVKRRNSSYHTELFRFSTVSIFFPFLLSLPFGMKFDVTVLDCAVATEQAPITSLLPCMYVYLSLSSALLAE